MTETRTLTELQVSILTILWERGEATTHEVHHELNTDREMALTTVATLLTRLEKKGFLAHRKDGRQHVYRATVSRGDVRRSKVRELTETLFDGDRAALVSHLMGADSVTVDDVEQIRSLLRDRDLSVNSRGPEKS